MRATVEKVTLAYSVITEFDSLTSSISIPGGAHQLVQHRAHLGLRRHGGGVAGGRTGGGGAQTGPFRAGVGDKGKGWGLGETLSRLPLPPRSVRKRSRRGCRRVRAALLTTTRTWTAAAAENDPGPLTPSSSWDRGDRG